MIDRYATLKQLALEAQAKTSALVDLMAEAGMLDGDYHETDGALFTGYAVEADLALHNFLKSIANSAVREP